MLKDHDILAEKQILLMVLFKETDNFTILLDYALEIHEQSASKHNWFCIGASWYTASVCSNNLDRSNEKWKDNGMKYKNKIRIC